jgi:hypothetical protein
LAEHLQASTIRGFHDGWGKAPEPLVAHVKLSPVLWTEGRPL